MPWIAATGSFETTTNLAKIGSLLATGRKEGYYSGNSLYAVEILKTGTTATRVLHHNYGWIGLVRFA